MKYLLDTHTFILSKDKEFYKFKPYGLNLLW